MGKLRPKITWPPSPEPPTLTHSRRERFSKEERRQRDGRGQREPGPAPRLGLGSQWPDPAAVAGCTTHGWSGKGPRPQHPAPTSLPPASPAPAPRFPARYNHLPRSLRLQAGPPELPCLPQARGWPLLVADPQALQGGSPWWVTHPAHLCFPLLVKALLNYTL